MGPLRNGPFCGLLMGVNPNHLLTRMILQAVAEVKHAWVDIIFSPLGSENENPLSNVKHGWLENQPRRYIEIHFCDCLWGVSLDLPPESGCQ